MHNKAVFKAVVTVAAAKGYDYYIMNEPTFICKLYGSSGGALVCEVTTVFRGIYSVLETKPKLSATVTGVSFSIRLCISFWQQEAWRKLWRGQFFTIVFFSNKTLK